jgi:hypothetical protein
MLGQKGVAARALLGGYGAWVGAGHPVEKGAEKK